LKLDRSITRWFSEVIISMKYLGNNTKFVDYLINNFSKIVFFSIMVVKLVMISQTERKLLTKRNNTDEDIPN